MNRREALLSLAAGVAVALLPQTAAADATLYWDLKHRRWPKPPRYGVITYKSLNDLRAPSPPFPREGDWWHAAD